MDDGKEDKSGRERPSYKAMAAFASEDPGTRITLANDTKARAVLDFGEELPEVDGPLHPDSPPAACRLWGRRPSQAVP